MHQVFLVSLCIVAGSKAQNYHQPPASPPIPILRMDVKTLGESGYLFSYETGNQIAQQEAGDGTKTEGSYAYVAPDGQQVSMTYVADATGFHPKGSHVPVPPPMPEAIRKAVEQNLADEAKGIVDDGQYRESKRDISLPAPLLPQQYRV